MLKSHDFWEHRYYNWNTTLSDFDLAKKLNSYGAFGWELVTAQFYGADMIFIKVIFKRIKNFDKEVAELKTKYNLDNKKII